MSEKIKMLDFTQCEWEIRNTASRLLTFQAAEGATVCLGEVKPGGEKHNPHAHAYEQVILLLQGEARLHANEEIHEMKPGCILAIPPGKEHMFEPLGEREVLYVDIFVPKRPDHAGLWTDSTGIKRETEKGEERVQSEITRDEKRRARINLFE